VMLVHICYRTQTVGSMTHISGWKLPFETETSSAKYMFSSRMKPWPIVHSLLANPPGGFKPYGSVERNAKQLGSVALTHPHRVQVLLDFSRDVIC
jgi:hypothetical protein